MAQLTAGIKQFREQLTCLPPICELHLYENEWLLTNNRTDDFTKSQWKSVFTSLNVSTNSNNTICRDLIYQLDDPKALHSSNALLQLTWAGALMQL